MTVEWDHSQGMEANHKAAARKLADALGWVGEWHGGGSPDSGYVFVCVGPWSAGFTVAAEAGR